MSERSSFVTEYIHCEKCFDALWEVLGGDHKFLKGYRIPLWREDVWGVKQLVEPDSFLPIIAGKIGDTAPHLEFYELERLLSAAKTCHYFRISLLCNAGCSHLLIKTEQGEIFTEDSEHTITVDFDKRGRNGIKRCIRLKGNVIHDEIDGFVT